VCLLFFAYRRDKLGAWSLYYVVEDDIDWTGLGIGMSQAQGGGQGTGGTCDNRRRYAIGSSKLTDFDDSSE
jgi:hypothetical protein